MWGTECSGELSNMQSVGVYHSDKYTAYFYPRSIVITTKYQSIRISADRYNGHLLELLIVHILRGKIKRMDELRDYQGALIWTACTRPKVEA